MWLVPPEVVSCPGSLLGKYLMRSRSKYKLTGDEECEELQEDSVSSPYLRHNDIPYVILDVFIGKTETGLLVPPVQHNRDEILLLGRVRTMIL